MAISQFNLAKFIIFVQFLALTGLLAGSVVAWAALQDVSVDSVDEVTQPQHEFDVPKKSHKEALVASLAPSGKAEMVLPDGVALIMPTKTTTATMPTDQNGKTALPEGVGQGWFAQIQKRPNA